MNGRQRNATNAQIWGKYNNSNYDGNCTSRHCLSRTYEISGRLIFVEQSVHTDSKVNKRQINTLGNFVLSVVSKLYNCDEMHFTQNEGESHSALPVRRWLDNHVPVGGLFVEDQQNDLRDAAILFQVISLCVAGQMRESTDPTKHT